MNTIEYIQRRNSVVKNTIKALNNCTSNKLTDADVLTTLKHLMEIIRHIEPIEDTKLLKQEMYRQVRKLKDIAIERKMIKSQLASLTDVNDAYTFYTARIVLG